MAVIIYVVRCKGDCDTLRKDYNSGLGPITVVNSIECLVEEKNERSQYT